VRLFVSQGAGMFVCLVGPSGAGKDTLLRLVKIKLASQPTFSFPCRCVTRAASAHEDHLVLTESAYREGIAAGRFALAWRAHGLGYGIERDVLPALAAGGVVICNVSREAIGAAKANFPRVATVLVTADADILIARLLARGRETRADIDARVARNREFAEKLPVDFTVVNSGAVEAAVEQLASVLHRIAATSATSAL
jgi:ribose 1,5-bisphosphokinase